MKGFGILLMIVGAASAFFSFAADVSVDSTYGSGDVLNIGLLQNQMMIFQLGLGGFISGCILFAAGAVLEAVQANTRGPANSVDEPEVGGEFNPKDHI